MPLQTFTIPALPAAPNRLTLSSPPARRSLQLTAKTTPPPKPSRTIPLATVQQIKQLYCSGQHKLVISSVSSLHLEKHAKRHSLTKQQKLTIATLHFLAAESRRELAFRQRRYLTDRRPQRPGSSSSADSDDLNSYRISTNFAVTETQRQARENLEGAKRSFAAALELMKDDEEREEEVDWLEKVKWERVEKAAEEFVACVREKLRDVEEELELGGRKSWRQRRMSGDIEK